MVRPLTVRQIVDLGTQGRFAEAVVALNELLQNRDLPLGMRTSLTNLKQAFENQNGPDWERTGASRTPDDAFFAISLAALLDRSEVKEGVARFSPGLATVTVTAVLGLSMEDIREQLAVLTNRPDVEAVVADDSAVIKVSETATALVLHYRPISESRVSVQASIQIQGAPASEEFELDLTNMVQGLRLVDIAVGMPGSQLRRISFDGNAEGQSVFERLEAIPAFVPFHRSATSASVYVQPSGWRIMAWAESEPGPPSISLTLLSASEPGFEQLYERRVGSRSE